VYTWRIGARLAIWRVTWNGVLWACPVCQLAPATVTERLCVRSCFSRILVFGRRQIDRAAIEKIKTVILVPIELNDVECTDADDMST
jgi:hypothetical protein